MKQDSVPEGGLTPIPVVMMGVLQLWADRGASIHMREVALSLTRQGLVPWIVCLAGPNGAQRDHRLHELHVPVMRTRFLLQLTWNIMSTITAIRAVVRSGSRIIYTRLDPGMFSAMVAAVLTRSKLVVEMNGLPTLDLSLYRPNNQFLIGISRLWEAAHYRYASAVVGARGYALYVQRHFRVAHSKFREVPLGVNTELFHQENREGALAELGLDNRPTVVWTGTMAGWQGLETLLQAAHSLRELVVGCQVLIIGDGPDLGKLRRRATELGLDGAVQFTGSVSYDLVPRYISAANVCVAMFPGSRGDKGTISALKTLNYLACGRPVVTTHMDEMADDIVRAGAGFATVPDNADELARHVATLLLEAPSEWRERCSRSRSLIDASRSWDGVARLIANALVSIR